MKYVDCSVQKPDKSQETPDCKLCLKNAYIVFYCSCVNVVDLSIDKKYTYMRLLSTGK